MPPIAPEDGCQNFRGLGSFMLRMELAEGFSAGKADAPGIPLAPYEGTAHLKACRGPHARDSR